MHDELRILLDKEFRKKDPKLRAFLHIETITVFDNEHKTLISWRLHSLGYRIHNGKIERLTNSDPYTPFGHQIFFDKEGNTEVWICEDVNVPHDGNFAYHWFVDPEAREYLNEGVMEYGWGTEEYGLIRDDTDYPSTFTLEECVAQFVEHVCASYRVYVEKRNRSDFQLYDASGRKQ